MSLLASAIIAAAIGQASGDLVLRSGEPAPSGSVVEVTIDGVTVGSAVTAPVIVGWDRVRTVNGDHAADAMAFVDVADMAWRASSRLARGDARAAEPVYEELLTLYEGRSGPTAAAVFEGLLRCRLRRNAQTLAVSAWLQWLSAREIADGAQWYQRRSASADVAPFVFDESTGLVPDLPPIWLDVPAVRVFASTPIALEELDSRERALAELYRHAAGGVSGRSEQLLRPRSSDPGVRLVFEIVAAQSAVAAERTIGRDGIEARLKNRPPGWQAAWLKAALGRSLLLEEELEARQRGLILLLEVFVRHEDDCPYLAGVALAEAAVGLHDLGNVEGALGLRREFLDRFPGHPAASWDRMLDLGSNDRSADTPGSESRGHALTREDGQEYAWFRI